MLERTISLTNSQTEDVLILATLTSAPQLIDAPLARELAELGPEGFVIRSVRIESGESILIASAGEVGALYGAFHFIRMMQTGTPLQKLKVADRPVFKLRLLNHWDRLDGSVERGYAGRSLWNWEELPENPGQRLVDYARANASIGINGAVLNNVNASAQSLTSDYLRKTAAIADQLRPYGIQVFLSARFSAPMELGGVSTADPLDPKVVAWWQAKAAEIHSLIPDFGGWLIKANSEGQPGPITYGRTHADGANMLAAALAPHGGKVIWRAFVYDPDPHLDRVAQAYETLRHFDGCFATNVLLQVKNGPLDFQPREPFHPLFGAMPKTQLMAEFQITQEYLGQAKQVAFLATMWREFLDEDIGGHRTVRSILTADQTGRRLNGIAGVANTGNDRNWTGHDLAQANWYAFGRLAWNPTLPAGEIAEEWTRLTFGREPHVIKIISDILLESREAVVDYMTPLGLAHLMHRDDHDGPEPWGYDAPRPDWNPIYYHRADTNGLGVDRTRRGSDAVSSYHPSVQKIFADTNRCPEKFILWFHHVPWNHRMRSGKTMWDELCLHYQRGLDWVRGARTRWNSLEGSVDADRFQAVADKLAVQERDALRWHNACLLYFQSFSGQPFPAGVETPRLTLEELKKPKIPAKAGS